MNGVLARLRRGLSDEKGQTLALFAVCLAAVLGCSGLAIDVGQLRYQKRQMQAAVDAAAVAAAIEINSCGSTADCSAMKTAAQQALVENGFSGSSLLAQCAANSNSGLTLTVNNGPCFLGSKSADPNYGNTGYVETVLTGPVRMYLGSLVGVRSIKVTVRAEAYAAPQFCMYVSVLNTSSSGPQAILLNGGTLTAQCGIYDDSGSSNALASNSGVTVTSTKFDVHGGWSPNNGGTFSSTPVVGASAVADPLSYLTAPTVPGSCTGNQSINSSQTLQPGCYSGFNVQNNSTLTLAAGTYIIEGAINVNSGSTLAGTGVTLYLTGSGSMTMNSGSKAALVAPTTGSLAGILIWQASSDTNAMIIDSGATAAYQGAIYAPSAQLTLNSGGNTAAYTILDVGSVILDSGAIFTLNDNYSSLPNGSPIKGGSAVMVE